LDLFFPSRLYPLDIGFMRESLEQTGRLVVVEEGQSFASLSSELLAQVAEARFVRPVRSVRVCAMPIAIPASRHLEEECLPGPDAIIAAALGVFDG
jgi:pyruvate dehydrogenase E1 component beta subunit